jgi:hypothetical protein
MEARQDPAQAGRELPGRRRSQARSIFPAREAEAARTIQPGRVAPEVLEPDQAAGAGAARPSVATEEPAQPEEVRTVLQ